MSNAPACERVCPVTPDGRRAREYLAAQLRAKSFLVGRIHFAPFPRRTPGSAAISKRRALDRLLLETLRPPFACGFADRDRPIVR